MAAANPQAEATPRGTTADGRPRARGLDDGPPDRHDQRHRRILRGYARPRHRTGHDGRHERRFARESERREHRERRPEHEQLVDGREMGVHDDERRNRHECRRRQPDGASADSKPDEPDDADGRDARRGREHAREHHHVRHRRRGRIDRAERVRRRRGDTDQIVEGGRIRHVARRERRRRQRAELRGAPDEQPLVRKPIALRHAPPDPPEAEPDRDDPDQDRRGADLHLLSNAADARTAAAVMARAWSSRERPRCTRRAR
jgi:hypothetical protein